MNTPTIRSFERQIKKGISAFGLKVLFQLYVTKEAEAIEIQEMLEKEKKRRGIK